MTIYRTILAATAGLGMMAVGTAQANGVTKTEILIGTHTALSGPVAPWGVGSVEGIRMVFDEVNKAGGIYGRKIKFIVEDNQYQVPRAVQAANKLINRDKIFLMLGALGTPMNNAVLPRQLKANIPNLFPFSSARQMFMPFNKLKFAALSTYYDQTRAGVKYFVEQKGKKVICDMYQDTDFGREIHLGVVDQVKAMGLKLTASTSHKPTETDFTAPVTKLRNAGCDLVMMGVIIRDAILPVATGKKMGYNPAWVGTVANMDTIVSAAKGGVTEGLNAVTSFELVYPDDPRPAVQKFFKVYKERTGKEPNQAAQLGQIIAQVTVQALKNAGPKLTVDSLIKGLEQIKDFHDIFGGPALSFGPKKHLGSNKSFLVTVKNGRWVRNSEILSY